jgi:hypothetical protein
MALVGDHIKQGTITRDQVVKLAEALFDGKRELPVGPLKIVTPDLKKVTPHIREMILTALLTAEAK